jgi:hypothetical protein
VEHVLEAGEGHHGQRRGGHRQQQHQPEHERLREVAAEHPPSEGDGEDPEQRGERERRDRVVPERADPRGEQHGPERRRRARGEARGDPPLVVQGEVLRHRQVDVGVVERVGEAAAFERAGCGDQARHARDVGRQHQAERSQIAGR